MNLELKCGDHTVHAFVQRQGSHVSRHSGKTLKSLEVIFDTLNEAQTDWAQKFANNGKTLETTIGTEPQQWRIGHHEYMTTNSSPGARFTWELLEAEQLKVEALIISGWELKPYKYCEEFQYDDVLRIEARVELSQEEVERFWDLPLYFQVVRKSLTDQPREMRFGRCLWSRSNNKYRVGLLLLDKKYDDERGHRGLNEPCETNDATRIARTSLVLNRLLDALTTKGLLSKTRSGPNTNARRKTG